MLTAFRRFHKFKPEPLKCPKPTMRKYSSVHVKIVDITLSSFELIPPPLLLIPLSSPLSPFSAGCRLRLILVLWRLSRSHKMQSELFCSSATWGDYPAVSPKPEAACCLGSSSCDIFVHGARISPVASAARPWLTAVRLLVIYFSSSVHFLFPPFSSKRTGLRWG